MAICSVCEKEMNNHVPCLNLRMEDEERNTFFRIKYGKETRKFEGPTCHDCGVSEGDYHHFGCDVEECPKCHGQLISCSCNLE